MGATMARRRIKNKAVKKKHELPAEIEEAAAPSAPKYGKKKRAK